MSEWRWSSSSSLSPSLLLSSSNFVAFSAVFGHKCSQHTHEHWPGLALWMNRALKHLIVCSKHCVWLCVYISNTYRRLHTHTHTQRLWAAILDLTHRRRFLSFISASTVCVFRFYYRYYSVRLVGWWLILIFSSVFYFLAFFFVN